MALRTLNGAGLSLENFVLSGGPIQGTSQESEYYFRRLLDPVRTERWRSTSTILQRLYQPFNASRLPTFVALVDPNFQPTPAAADLSALLAKFAIRLRADLETGADGSQAYRLADRSGNGRDFVIDSVFGSSSFQNTITQFHRADAIAPQTDGTGIASWIDSATGGVPSATQATGSRQPTYRTAPNGQNGLPVVQFNDGNDVLDFGSDLNFGTQHTLVFVFRLSTLTGAHVLASGGSGGTASFVTLTPGLNVITYTVAGTGTVSVTWTPTLNQWHVVAIQRNGASVKFAVDGVQVGSTQTLGSGPDAAAFLCRYIGDGTGTDASMVGQLASWMRSSSVADDFLSEAVAAMARKWAITITPRVTLETNEQDQRSVIRYDGTTGFAGYHDQLSYLNNSSAGFLLGTAQTLPILVKFSTINAFNTFFGDTGSGGTGSFFRYLSASGGTLTLQVGSSGAVSVTGVGLTTGVWYTIVAVRSGASVSFFVNGAQVGATQTLGATPAAANFGWKTLGADNHLGSSWLVGDIAEAGAIPEALSTAERKLLEDYIAATWNTPMAFGSLVLELANDLAFTTDRLAYVLSFYRPGRPGVWRAYLGAPDNDRPAAARTHWRLTIPAGIAGSDAFYQIGNVWLGEDIDIEPSPANPRTINPSHHSTSAAGATFSDTMSRYREHPVKTGFLTFEQVYDLTEKLERLGNGSLVFDPHAGFVDPSAQASVIARSTLYGMLSPRSEIEPELVGPEQNVLRFVVQEHAG